MKKILFVGVVVFAFVLTMNVAFASTTCGGFMQPVCPCPDQSNSAYDVSNQVMSSASTGLNQNTYSFGSAGIATGSAYSEVYGANAINSNLKTGATYGFGSTSQVNTAVKVNNVVSSGSFTGENGNTYTGSASINTGAAGSSARGINLVNTNVKIGCPCAGQPTCGCTVR